MTCRSILKRLGLKLPLLREFIREHEQLRAAHAQALVELQTVSAELDQLQATLLRLSEGSAHPGYCHCCHQRTFFLLEGEWLRDQYLCAHCRSIPRQRHLHYVLDTHFPGWEKQIIHESSPTIDFIARWCERYSSSQYFEGVASGEAVNGVRCENLERLSFADDSIDIFITQDVLEHVFHPELAAREICRALKPGGAHVFTVPRQPWLPASEARARLSATGIEYLKDADYHGNPVGDGRALVTWDYGADFERLIERWSGMTTTVYADVNRALGIDGELREVFVSRKPQ
ncbi:MAG: class I SAM-dependent methyltransferase [Pseudomonadales bacterium]|jgi:SAM-dependent methyltransferase|nr:class I SAM-dependent methyltransferase [Pseudomonadales bacterium]